MADVLSFPSSSSGFAAKLQPKDSIRGHSSIPNDSIARAAALDSRRSFIVEAPAGSGKTGLLMQRFLTLLGDPATTGPEQILAITFTRKATAELRERIFQQLEDALTDTPLADSGSAFAQQTRALAQAALQRDREQGWRLLSDPRRLRIQTIDALCIEIASALPLLAGSAARAPVDDASDLYRQAARRTLRLLGGPDRQLHDALEAVLLHRDANLGEVETLLAGMLQTREQWAELVPLDRASLTDEVLDSQVRLRLERTLEQVVCAGLTCALKLIPAHALAELAGLAHNYAEEPGYNGKDSPIRLCSEHPGPPAAEAAHLDHWHALLCLMLTKDCEWRKVFHKNVLEFELSKRDKDRLKEVVLEIQSEPLREALESVRCLPPAKYPDDQWRQAKALFRLLLHTLAELKLLFAETGQCDFSEFSLAARSALEHHAEDFVAGSGSTLRHLLVDEMQDTSSAQYDLLTALTRSWDGCSQTLFLVGDPKQSIYLFRQARVERFLRTARDGRLGDVPLQPLQLTANFRSRPAVVAGVNDDFIRLFTPPGQPLSPDTVDVPFVEATPTRDGTSAAGVHWHTRVLPSAKDEAVALKGTSFSSYENNPPRNGALAPEGMPGESHIPPGLALAASATLSPQQEDAAAIRKIVEVWRAKPLPADRAGKPWRIAVLANARRHLAPITAEFNRADADRSPIPYRAVKVELLQERPEVLDVFALTRALHHPADRTAWFAVLRAPWCGLGVADLLTLAAEDEASEAKSTVVQLVENRMGFLPPAGQQLLIRTWSTLQAALPLIQRNQLSEIVERTWRSLGGDTTLNTSERTNVERYFALLREAQTEGTLDLAKLKRRMKDLYAEPAAATDAVELMTIHSAKGLEWDVVFVPELGRQGQRESSRLLNWLELESGSEPAVLLAPIASRGEGPSSLYRWLDKVHCARLAAERKRVFYVACTRAREELHLFAAAKQTKAGLSPAPNSLLHACWPAAVLHFERNASAQAALEDSSPALGLQVVSAISRDNTDFSEDADLGLALAAGAAPEPDPADLAAASRSRYLPRLTRLPSGFDPADRFRAAAARRLPYTPAADLPHGETLARPEGSIAVRARGNVVHRFLEQIARRLATDASSAALLAELPTWLDRLTASLRGEGLAPTEAAREAGRALTLLTATLSDPVGLWLLSPHPAAASERAISTAAGLLRVDRTFQAGDAPLSTGDGTIWVVDFKTTEPGGRSPEDFLAHQRELYAPQLARYATALRADANTQTPQIQLGLYFPSIPHLIDWAAEEV